MGLKLILQLSIILLLTCMCCALFPLMKIRKVQKEELVVNKININQGDIVRIIAPARASPLDALQPIENYVKSLGLVPNITTNIYNNTEPFYSNWDEFRANDLISALTDVTSKVIWCIRGGTGSIRLIPYLEERLPATLNYKIFIGYSDITVLHLYLQKKYGWQTIHGAMLEAIARQQYPPLSDSVVILTNLIFQRQNSTCYPLMKTLNDVNVSKIESSIVGGNVALVEASVGTMWEVNASGKILFLEDTGESAYSIERSLDHMKQAGIFKDVDGVIFSDFTAADNNTLMDIVLDRFAKSTSFPVFRISGIGHGSINLPLPFSTYTEITRNTSDTYQLCVNNINGSTTVGNNANRQSLSKEMFRLTIFLLLSYFFSK